jgi:hypothetical protein
MAQQQMLNAPLPSEDDMIGAIKIKDALFIGDEFAAQVRIISYPFPFLFTSSHSFYRT